jgi:hypothetical protein
MSQGALFAAGAAVSVLVFTGGFLYAMLAFNRWTDKDDVSSDRTNPG